MLTVGTDSYINFDDLDSYVSHNLDVFEFWETQTPIQKEFYSKASMIILDKQNWIGIKSNENQPLEFPRDFAVYSNDPRRSINYEDNFYNNSFYDYFNSSTKNPYIKNSNIIFVELQKAQAEIVINLINIKSDESLKQLTNLKNIGVESFKVSSLSFNFVDGAGKKLPLPEEAYKLLKYYLIGEGDVMRIERG